MRSVALKMMHINGSLMREIVGTKKLKERLHVSRQRTRLSKLQEPVEKHRFAQCKRFNAFNSQRDF